MKAIQLTGFSGVDSMKLVDVPIPVLSAGQVLIKVKAAGVNYAEVEQIHGKYLTFGKELPFVMGFEVAGTIEKVSPDVEGIKIGDAVTTMALSGGFAEYAIADAAAVIHIPVGLSFEEATTIPLQGMTAYTLLKYGVLPAKPSSVLIQAAAGGVGLYLVQLAKLMGIEKVIAMAGSDEKLSLVKELGADIAINYLLPDWTQKVKEATNGKGVDVVLQMLMDEVGEESFKLLSPEGKIILFGAKNYHDTISVEQVRQLIWQNQTLSGFAYPALPVKKIKESIPELCDLIEKNKLKIFAKNGYQLSEVKNAFLALQSRKTIGKVYLRL
jgi:NADPH:quinone reductase